MKKKIFLVLILFLMCRENVFSLNCDNSTISRLKSLVSNINLSYNYKFVDGATKFDVTLTNVPTDVYFKDVLTDKIYNSIQNGEITISNYTGESGRYIFYSNINECKGVNLGSKYYKFPVYNIYHNDPLCSDIPNYSLCKKWVNKLYSYNDFKNKINEYKSSLGESEEIPEEIVYEKSLLNSIIEFYIKYYYILLIGVILVCWIIIEISRRRNKFKL